ncbi:PREDICTED: uncharacterized protein LOC109228064 [Nicotiana attenuata]|uniref:uncharacterized protein LOC109228064 n=1 Tax=Nicotiana attenuata TaxID=49451 RepID=UPI0009059426|nr:PREDICTED: uncharacterized protein LOC109228064 [Nicotiana attenuata]
MLDLKNQGQSIITSFDKQSEKAKSEYRVRLNASIDVARYLLKEGMPFRGHDESETSTRRGNFLDLLKWYADKKEDVKNVVLENAPKNDIMICPSVQKDIVRSCAKETLKAIIKDLNWLIYFGILVDESKDVSHKEQMHYMFCSSIAIDSCGCCKEHYEAEQFFDILANVLNIVGGSFKRREMLRDDQAEKLEELLMLGEVHTGSGLNQELGLQRAGDTCWSSHFKTVRNFISLFSLIVHVLGILAIEGSNYHERSMAKILVDDIRSYEFVYMLHLMLKVLALTYDLNMALQKKDQDIVSAMKLVGFAKRQLQVMRESGWNSLVEDVCLFCIKHDIVIPEMDMNFSRGKSKRKKSSVTYSYHLRIEVFYTIIDLQLSELNSRFSEVNTDLLLGMASLSPDNSFANYDKDGIMKLATHYPNEFTNSMLEDLGFELDIYIDYVREAGNEFSNLKSVGDLSETMVKTNLHMTWRLVYLLVKLSLILSVATATFVI